MVIRVAQWATGAVGRAALQELIENPDFQLVGVLVYDPAKAGLDAGALCGLPPTTGVLATTDKDEILALGADVVDPCRQQGSRRRDECRGHLPPARGRHQRHQHDVLQPPAHLRRRD